MKVLIIDVRIRRNRGYATRDGHSSNCAGDGTGEAASSWLFLHAVNCTVRGNVLSPGKHCWTAFVIKDSGTTRSDSEVRRLLL